MSKRAEQAALKAWPILVWNHSDINSSHRTAFQRGYEQALKDVLKEVERRHVKYGEEFGKSKEMYHLGLADSMQIFKCEYFKEEL